MPDVTRGILNNNNFPNRFKFLTDTDFNAVDATGETAMHFAVDNNDQDTIRRLIARGANVNIWVVFSIR